ncbi:MAG: transglutaminase family protein [Succinivibrio sp.]|jgi:transglutaminase-like putative cysteine protease|nr:transglutaminase family protein [Succinivibrio sp.]
MKKFLYSLRTDLYFSAPVSRHTFLLRAFPGHYPFQEPVNASLTCKPQCKLAQSTDGFGNSVHQGYIEPWHTGFSFISSGEVITDSSKHDTRPPAPYYALPSELTKLEGKLADFYRENKTEGTSAQKLERWLEAVQKGFKYQKGRTTTATTAAQAFEQGAGVCQDYAHILLSLLRADHLPCRYVAGMLAGEGASHAWIELYDGREWIAADPTHCRLCDDQYLKLSHGTDFASAPIERGVFIENGEAVTQSVQSRALMREI